MRACACTMVQLLRCNCARVGLNSFACAINLICSILSCVCVIVCISFHMDATLVEFPLGSLLDAMCCSPVQMGVAPGAPCSRLPVALRHFSLGVDPPAAYWDFDLLDGHGGWRAEGCHITGSAHNTTTIHCAHHNNNLAVLMVRVSRWKSDCGGAEPMKHGEHVHSSAIVLILVFQGRMV